MNSSKKKERKRHPWNRSREGNTNFSVKKNVKFEWNWNEHVREDTSGNNSWITGKEYQLKCMTLRNHFYDSFCVKMEYIFLWYGLYFLDLTCFVRVVGLIQRLQSLHWWVCLGNQSREVITNVSVKMLIFFTPKSIR